MGEMNTPHSDNEPMTEDEIIAIYESLRAAEKDSSLPFPYSDRTEAVHLDWKALEKRVLTPSLPEVVRNAFLSISPRALAYSIVGPVVGLLATFFWLRDVPIGWTREFFLTAFSAAAILVLMFLWAAVAMQAMHRLGRPPKVAEDELPLAAPVFVFRARGMAFACFATILLLGAAIGYIALRGRVAITPAPVTASQEPDDVIDEAVVDPTPDQDAVGGTIVKTGSVANDADPGEGSRERKAILAAAEAAYQKLMRLTVSDPEASKQRDILADEALAEMNRAKDVEPGRATIWTRLAEIYFLKEDLDKARDAIATVDGLDNVPSLEKRRAKMIHAAIETHDIARRVREAPREEARTQLAAQIDRTIKEVETTTRKTGADPGSLLTHLHLARAKVAKNAGERNRSEEQAADSSLEALNEPASALRTVDRPAALTRPAQGRVVHAAQSENLVPTATSGSRPPN